MFENPRRGRQARNFTTNVSKILDLKSSSEQIFFRKLSLGAPDVTLEFRDRHSVSSLRYRNRAKITILMYMCEQKSPVWYGFRAGVLA